MMSSCPSLLCINSDIVLTSSTSVATLFLSSNGHDDVTMHVAIVPVYKELDTVPPSSSSDRAQCE
jgi:hypothetical protein